MRRKSNGNTLSTLVDKNHPLRLMDSFVPEVITHTIKHLSAPGGPEIIMPLETALRAFALESYYWTPDREFYDHLQFNRLFRCFVGLDPNTCEFDWRLYSKQISILSLVDELRPFLEQLAAAGYEAGSDPEEGSTCSQDIAERWKNNAVYNYPKPVYFTHYTKSPIAEVRFTLNILPDKSEKPVFPPELLSERLNQTFPVKIYDSKESFCLESNDQLYRVIYLAESSTIQALSLSFFRSRPEVRYKTWEETIQPYVAEMVMAAREVNAEARIASGTMLFSNRFLLNREDPEERRSDFHELHQYFNMLPSQPAAVTTPRLMSETDQNYEFPRQLRSASYKTKLFYNDGQPHNMDIAYEIMVEESDYKIKLDLDACWGSDLEEEYFSLAKVLEVAGQLKQDIYVTFHSVITDKTRELFQ